MQNTNYFRQSNENSSISDPYPLPLLQKKSIPTPRKVIRNSLGEGVLKAQILEARYEANRKFLGGRGVQNENLP